MIERLPIERFRAIMDAGPPNCGIVQYSRLNPQTGEVGEHWQWMRLACPSDSGLVQAGEAWDGKWRRIERPEYSSQELLERAKAYPQIFDTA